MTIRIAHARSEDLANACRESLISVRKARAELERKIA